MSITCRKFVYNNRGLQQGLHLIKLNNYVYYNREATRTTATDKQFKIVGPNKSPRVGDCLARHFRSVLSQIERLETTQNK